MSVIREVACPEFKFYTAGLPSPFRNAIGKAHLNILNGEAETRRQTAE